MTYEKEMDLPQGLVDIPPGMFSSEQIWLYINEGWLIETTPEEKQSALCCLGPATYEMRLGRDAARYNDGKKERIYLAEVTNKNIGEYKELVLEPNSLTFVSTYEKFKLPNNVIARFNLKVKYVHKGLLLGTGPIVDPGYNSTLMIPIHNFSNSKVYIPYKEPFISVEFTKLLPIDGEHYVKNKNTDKTFDQYLEKAGPVESSIEQGIHNVLKRVSRCENNLLRLQVVSVVGLITILLALFAIFSDYYIAINNTLNNLQNFFMEYVLNNQNITK